MWKNSAVQDGGVLYEGKAKRLRTTADPGTLRVEFLDQATAFNGEKKDQIEGKGALNAAISAALFQYLADHDIPSHFVAQPEPAIHLVQSVQIIPLEVVVRNVAAGSLCQRLGLEEGRVLDYPIVEYFYKDDSLGDPLLNDEHIGLLQLATADEITEIRRQALEVNRVLRELFESVGIVLVDFKLEFGRAESGGILLADELSPDNCRLWDLASKAKLDKDVYRADLGDLVPVYQKVLELVSRATKSAESSRD